MAATNEPVQYRELREVTLLERVLKARRLSPVVAVSLFAAIISIALGLFHLFIALYGAPEPMSFRSTHLVVMLNLAVLLNPLCRQSILDPVLRPGAPGNALRCFGFAVDLALVASALAIEVYTLADVEALLAREGEISNTDMVAGTALVLLVLEATRRAVGWGMVVITGFFIVQTLYGNLFPGIFYGAPVSLTDFIDHQYVQSTGIFGLPLLVAATYIILFIIFSGILIRSGAGQFFIDLAVALTGRQIGGPAKAAVVASAFLGTVSGSSTANAVTTGSFTIPLMKRLGYRARFAAAVEACASSGGQITPPIMGAAAFIMAEFMRVSYLSIMVAAVIPTFLYFATVYFMVHIEAGKRGVRRMPPEDLPDLAMVLGEGWHLLLSLVVLIGLLSVGYTATLSGVWGIIVLVGLTFVNARTRMSPVDFLAALESGVRSAVPVTIACACAGIIIGSVYMSGLGLRFTNSVIEMAGGNLFFLLMLTGLAAIVLGMGITSVAVYITVAALIVPALIDMKVNPYAAHMFAFYYGVVSAITPPVAITAFAAAAIAGSPPMATAFEAARIGVAKYIVPFVFVYNPSLLFQGPWYLTLYSFAAAMAGVWGVSLGLEGWYRGPIGAAGRLLAGASGILLMWPPGTAPLGISGFLLNLAGGLALGGLMIARFRSANLAPVAAVESGDGR